MEEERIIFDDFVKRCANMTAIAVSTSNYFMVGIESFIYFFRMIIKYLQKLVTYRQNIPCYMITISIWRKRCGCLGVRSFRNMFMIQK